FVLSRSLVKMQGTAFSNQEQHQCQQCMQFIQDRYYLQVMDKTWHLNCLRCADCKLSLDSQQTCFAKDGLIYCKDDYYKRFPRKCNNCFQAINPNEFVMRSRQFIFHLNCFKCMVCERQLNTGEEYGINCKDGSIYCRVHYSPVGDNEAGFDYMSSLPPTPGISPASQTSTPLFNLNLNSDESQKSRAKKRKAITDSTNKKSSLHKKAAHKASPSKDDADIADSPDEFQSSANLDYYSDNEDDYLDTSTSSAANQNNAANGTNYYDSVAAVAAAAAAAAAAQRQKRMRTSFKHHQLRVMKSYFELNHNPDAKDLKQLSQKTGLSKRVLQVWFQNARAKFRRGQSNPCGADPVGELAAMNTSNAGVSSSSTSSISSSSSTSNQQHMAQHMDPLDHEDSSSHSLSLENLDKQLGHSSDINYTLLENTSTYGQNYMFNSSSASLHLPHSNNYTNLNHQIISHHALQSNNAPGPTQAPDFNSNSLCVDNLII
ncbi:LIM homeobox Lhx2 isoform X2, partial [Brachionus plicatilis]